jgi:hypothetical protein
MGKQAHRRLYNLGNIYRVQKSTSMTVKQAKRLNKQDHRLLALWAADCAEHVLANFEGLYPNDDRPRNAIEACKVAFASHAAARDAKNPAAYAVKAAGNGDEEIDW